MDAKCNRKVCFGQLKATKEIKTELLNSPTLRGELEQLHYDEDDARKGATRDRLCDWLKYSWILVWSSFPTFFKCMVYRY